MSLCYGVAILVLTAFNCPMKLRNIVVSSADDSAILTDCHEEINEGEICYLEHLVAGFCSYAHAQVAI